MRVRRYYPRWSATENDSQNRENTAVPHHDPKQVQSSAAAVATSARGDALDPAATQRAREAAGSAAAQLVQAGMVVGLGTGDTAAHAIRTLAARKLPGLRCVATSTRSAALAAELGLALIQLDDLAPQVGAQSKTTSLSLPIDLTIDGADEIDPHLQLIKGAGGALLFEKLVAQRSQQLIIIADPAKQVHVLGEKRLLPIEIVRFAAQHTLARIATLPGIRTAALRQAAQGIYITDGGNYILDVQLQPGVPAQPLHNLLKSLTGVIETGLFCTEASSALIGQGDGSVTQLCKSGVVDR